MIHIDRAGILQFSRLLTPLRIAEPMLKLTILHHALEVGVLRLHIAHNAYHVVTTEVTAELF